MGHLEDRLVLDVRRAYILKDALKEAKKEKFSPKWMVKVWLCHIAGEKIFLAIPHRLNFYPMDFLSHITKFHRFYGHHYHMGENLFPLTFL